VNLTTAWTGWRPGRRDGLRELRRHRGLGQNGNQCRDAGVSVHQLLLRRDPLDVAIVCAAAMGACFGFLWWNSAPPRSSWATPARWRWRPSLAAIAMVTRTELLLLVIGGLFVVETRR
jgi:phospho-N-acetylmuramoyl-pentapeptide-transferase